MSTGAGAGAAARRLSLPAALIAAVGTATAAVAAFGGAGLNEELTTALVFLVIVVGLYTFVGTSGIVSFGHMAFMGVGGYSFALMTIPPRLKGLLLPDLPAALRLLSVQPAVATLIAGVVAAAFAAVIGWPLMRLTPLAAAIALFAVLNIVFVIATQAYVVTRGQEGMTGVPASTTGFSAFVWAGLAIVAAFAFQSSTVGLRLRCAREDELAARAIGIRIVPERYAALLLSAFLIGIGGALFAGLLQVVAPSEFYIDMTFTTIAMLVVGGMRSLSGAVVGTAFVFAVEEVLRSLENGFTIGPLSVASLPGLELLGVAALGLVVLVGRPGGVTGGQEIL